MKRVLADIQTGKFTRDWMLENRVNQTSFKAMRAKMRVAPDRAGRREAARHDALDQEAKALVDKSRRTDTRSPALAAMSGAPRGR